MTTRIPTHIKELADRIIREYELLCQQRHKVALQIFRDNRIYSGVQTTEYCLALVKKFRTQLDSPDTAFLAKTEKEFRRQIYQKICEFYKPLSSMAIMRITRTTECQYQLESALYRAKKQASTSSDAHQMSWFIANGSTQNWCQLDESIEHKIFKLIRSEEEFEKLISKSNKNPITEITQESIHTYSQFRIALQPISIKDGYRKQSRIREFNNFWENSTSIDHFDIDFTVFNMWNDIKETGIYYVFIP